MPSRRRWRAQVITLVSCAPLFLSFVSLVCMHTYICVCVCVCARSQMCVSFLMSVESDRGGGRGGSDRVSSSRVSRWTTVRSTRRYLYFFCSICIYVHIHIHLLSYIYTCICIYIYTCIYNPSPTIVRVYLSSFSRSSHSHARTHARIHARTHSPFPRVCCQA